MAQTAQEFSQAHITAYHKWIRSSSDRISEDDVAAIEREDPASGQQIRAERARTVERDVARMRQQHQQQAPPQAPAAPLVSAWPETIDTDEQQLDSWFRSHAKHATTPSFVVAAIANFFQHAGVKAFSKETVERYRAAEARVNALEARIVSLEARPQVQHAYKGVWTPETSYQQHDFVTVGGSMWAAKIDNRNRRPGSDPDAWQLAVKAGKDAR